MVCAARRGFDAVAPGILGEHGMRRYRTEIDNVPAYLRSLWVVIGLQFIVVLILWFSWSQAPKQVTLHVPLVLRSGATLSVDDMAATNVYAFAFNIFQ
ncbi:MAG: DUF2895 family protein [Candidatus Thiodiazotropha sp.]